MCVQLLCFLPSALGGYSFHSLCFSVYTPSCKRCLKAQAVSVEIVIRKRLRVHVGKIALREYITPNCPGTVWWRGRKFCKFEVCSVWCWKKVCYGADLQPGTSEGTKAFGISSLSKKGAEVRSERQTRAHSFANEAERNNQKAGRSWCCNTGFWKAVVHQS